MYSVRSSIKTIILVSCPWKKDLESLTPSPWKLLPLGHPSPDAFHVRK